MVPVMSPVEGLMASPAGRPVALLLGGGEACTKMAAAVQVWVSGELGTAPKAAPPREQCHFAESRLSQRGCGVVVLLHGDLQALNLGADPPATLLG